VISPVPTSIQNTASNNDVYFQSRVSLNDHWSLTAGARHDQISISNANLTNSALGGVSSFSATTPVVGLTWHVQDNWNLYTNAGLGFETPTTNEMAYSLQGNSLTSNFNAGLQASQSHNFEWGSKWMPGKGQAFNAAVFYVNTLNDIVASTNVSGKSVYRNAAQTIRKGLEINWSDASSAHFKKQLSMTLMRAQYASDFSSSLGVVASGNSLPAIPNTSLFAAFSWSELGYGNNQRSPLGSEVELNFNARSMMWANDLNTNNLSTSSLAPGYASAHFTAAYDGELAAKALAPYAKAKIGLLGTAAISHALMQTLREGEFANTQFVDASEMVDEIKCIKSEEEIAFIRRVAHMQDLAMQAVFEHIKPGMRDIEVAAIAEQVGHAHGSEQGLFLCASGPVGSVPVFANRHQQNRVIQAGDQFTLLIENSGAGGFYAELGRTCVLGKASQEMKEEFEFVLQAQRYTTELLKPGADCVEIWHAYNQFMREHHRPEEKRLHCHGQGYDMVERPLVRMDETMKIAKNMVLSAHPTYTTDRTYSWACDDFLVGEHNANERLHRFPQKIFEL
jgi:Xaa-Pro aminopeptidase